MVKSDVDGVGGSLAWSEHHLLNVAHLAHVAEHEVACRRGRLARERADDARLHEGRPHAAHCFLTADVVLADGGNAGELFLRGFK